MICLYPDEQASAANLGVAHTSRASNSCLQCGEAWIQGVSPKHPWYFEISQSKRGPQSGNTGSREILPR